MSAQVTSPVTAYLCVSRLYSLCTPAVTPLLDEVDVVMNSDIVFVFPPADPPTTVAAGAVWQTWVDSDTWASLTSYRRSARTLTVQGHSKV